MSDSPCILVPGLGTYRMDAIYWLSDLRESDETASFYFHAPGAMWQHVGGQTGDDPSSVRRLHAQIQGYMLGLRGEDKA